MALRCERSQLFSVRYSENVPEILPLEAMVFGYAQLAVPSAHRHTTVIAEMADYYEKEIGYHIPSRTPFARKQL